MPPPSAQTLPTIRPNHEDRDQGEACPQTTEQLIRLAHQALETAGLRMGTSKVTRIVRTYKAQAEQSGLPFLHYLVNAAQLDGAAQRRVLTDRVLGAAVVRGGFDPTGETAVARVMRGGGHA